MWKSKIRNAFALTSGLAFFAPAIAQTNNACDSAQHIYPIEMRPLNTKEKFTKVGTLITKADFVRRSLTYTIDTKKGSGVLFFPTSTTFGMAGLSAAQTVTVNIIFGGVTEEFIKLDPLRAAQDYSEAFRKRPKSCKNVPNKVPG